MALVRPQSAYSREQSHLLRPCDPLGKPNPIRVTPKLACTPLHGCAWETFYIFAYCELVGNPHLAVFFCSPSNVNQVWGGTPRIEPHNRASSQCQALPKYQYFGSPDEIDFGAALEDSFEASRLVDIGWQIWLWLKNRYQTGTW